VRVTACGTVARASWKVGTAELPRGLVGVVGWNIPIARATGLDVGGQRQFGSLLESQMVKAGIDSL
jgi:hypothetical protein